MNNLNHFYFLIIIMYQLPQLVLWTIYSYINRDIDKLIFIAEYSVNINKRNISIILENEYDINNPITIDYLALGYKLKLSRNSNYFDSRLNKYYTPIYGCYIYTLNELNKLKTINHNIIHLKFNIDFNDMVTCDNLPDSITHLYIDDTYTPHIINNLPYSLSYLKLPSNYDMSLLKIRDIYFTII